MRKEEYSEFLKHPLWEQKRQEVFYYYGKRCKNCGAGYNLQVHHKTYSNGKMPWEYPIETFEVLCGECHSNTHGFRYHENKCRECGRTIAAQFLYCLDCHNSLKERKEKEKAELEFKIEELEKVLYREQNKNKEQDEKISNHESVVKQLLSEKDSLETKINKTKAQMNQRFKEEECKKDIKSKEIESLVNEKESLETKINELQTRISNINRSVGSFSQEKKILNDVNKKLNEAEAQMSQRLKEEKRISDQKSQEVEQLLREKDLLENKINEAEAQMSQRLKEEKRISDQKSQEVEQLLREKDSLENKINETEAQMNQSLKEEKRIRDQKSQEIERLLSETSTLEKERIEIVEVIKELQNLNNTDSNKRAAENNAFKGSILTQINHLKKFVFLFVFFIDFNPFCNNFFLKK